MRFAVLYQDVKLKVSTDLLTHILERQNKLTKILSDQHQQGLLPSLGISKFKGDPIDYHVFIRTFKTRIESRLNSNEARLQHLEQHLEGEAKELIKGCLHMEPSLGYAESKRLLDEKYGDPYQVSNAYLAQVTNWPALKPGDDVALDIFLFNSFCYNRPFIKDSQYQL